VVHAELPRRMDSRVKPGYDDTPSLRAKRSNPVFKGMSKPPWFASSLSLLAMTLRDSRPRSRTELRNHARSVMAGLVPAIHVLLGPSKDVDAPHEAGHDG
jgi:hypothetical protein